MSQNQEETFAFQAEINQLMSLIINTFYSNKDVFLRELVSNSSDALDKIRHQSLKDENKLNSEKNLNINIKCIKDKGLLTIEDSGIGMTKEDLINNLGTIAKSGTKGFMEALENGGDLSMIGQFGVGFYSAYLVADKVSVYSKNNDDEEYCWESSAGGSFTIKKSDTGLTRGTRLELLLKDDQKDLLEEHRIKDLIKKHSEFISYPISLWVEKTREKTVEDDADDADEEDETVEDGATEDGATEDADDDTKKKEPKTITETYNEWEEINKEKPLWCKNPEEITEEEYNKFYKHISNDFDDYKKVKHFSVEGQLEFKGILYLPKRAPQDTFEPNKKKSNIKLYVRKIFITDECDDLCPEWMTFVKGIVDSEDLPLNISRETLQKNQIMKVMKKNIIKKVIECMTDFCNDDDSDYDTWYNEFSKNIKLGIHEDSTNRDKLCKLLKYNSTKSVDKLIRLDDYIKNMKEGQDSIYYISGESLKSIQTSLFLEELVKRDYEVLLMSDPIDEYCMQQLKEYDGKKFVNITKENLQLEKTDDEKKIEEENKKKYEDVCKFIKETLGNYIEKVVVSSRLNASPCCLVTSEYGWTANMERIMKAQALRNDSMMNSMMSRKTLEINPDSDIIKELHTKISTNKDDITIKDIIWLLFETTLLNSGFNLEQSDIFCNRIYRMIRLGLSINMDNDDSSDDDIDTIDDIDAKKNIDSTEDVESESVMEEVD